MKREPTGWATTIGCFLVCLAGLSPASAQTQDSPPVTAKEKTENGKREPAPQPPRRDRTPQKREAAGEERPRLDVPVSFPVDI